MTYTHPIVTLVSLYTLRKFEINILDYYRHLTYFAINRKKPPTMQKIVIASIRQFPINPATSIVSASRSVVAVAKKLWGSPLVVSVRINTVLTHPTFPLPRNSHYLQTEFFLCSKRQLSPSFFHSSSPVEFKHKYALFDPITFILPIHMQPSDR